MERLSGGVLWRTTTTISSLSFVFFSYLCRANLLESKIPFGEEKVLEGVGQLRPHGTEPARGRVLPGHGQPDGQHLQQG